MAEPNSTMPLSKKQEKKNRRAAKVQQKEVTESGEQHSSGPLTPHPSATPLPPTSTPLVSDRLTSTPLVSDTPTSAEPSGSESDGRARCIATVKEQSSVSDTSPLDTSSKENQSPSLSSGGSKKTLSKAERRELQEAQRKAKAEKKLQSPSQHASAGHMTEGTKKSKGVNEQTPVTDQTSVQQVRTCKPAKSAKGSPTHLFSHLPAYRDQVPKSKHYIPPAIAQVGLQYSKGVVCGSNARAVALLCALKQVIADYVTPHQKELARDLHDKVKIYMEYLHSCRPVAVSMDSISKYICPIILCCSGMPDSEAKQYLLEELERFYKERIYSSDDVISCKTLEKIDGNDVILTYGHSSLVLKVLVAAARKCPSISIIVVDSRPQFEGREMLRKLMKHCPRVSLSYVLISSISYVMTQATKVLIGAHGILGNGYVMSRTGTAQVASMAKTFNVPVLVCCETYKFSLKMQTDSFISNELGDSTQMVTVNGKAGPLAELGSRANLHILNLRYDITPPDYVTGLITETAVIPCTSAPVVIRVKQQYNLVNIKS